MPPRSVDDNALLDAARRCVLERGVRRTTLTDVAREAGVSRVTIYRRYPSLEAVLSALMTREFGALVEQARERATALATGRERAVEAAAYGAELLAANELFRRIVDVDPELLLPYLTRRLGAFQKLVLAALSGAIATGHEDGSVRAGEPDKLAATIERTVRGFVLAVPAQDDHALGELRPLLDRYLSP